MAKRSRPAQGNNSNKPFPGKTISAGGDNVRTSGRKVPRVNNGKPRRAS